MLADDLKALTTLSTHEFKFKQHRSIGIAAYHSRPGYRTWFYDKVTNAYIGDYLARR